ncbi:STAS domain-containing protein [Streptomyces subrutilus]|uniref:STAS domain-containing protein n=1 Tax=Streptomyces subrutilus TaxID=36818 RepID=UPI001431A2FA|nr:STAS domain-containing protein [Streptomyces subrutilus]
MEPTVTVLPDREGLRVVRCAGEFDRTNLGPLRTACETAVAAGVDRVVLDVRGVTFGDSTFLHLLLTFNDRCDLRLGGPLTRQVARLLSLTGTDQVLTVDDDLADGRVE